MLTPYELSQIPDSLIQTYQELEDFIIQDFARRVAKTGTITDTAQWQAIRAQELGMSIEAIKQKVAEILNISYQEVDKLFEQSAITSVERDNALYENTKMTPMHINTSPELQQYLEAATKQTKGELKNITQSLGVCTIGINNKVISKKLTTFYQNALDLAQFQVSSGVLDYQTAVRNAIKSIASSGIRTIDFESGWHNRIDVAVRRATLTGANQMAQQMNNKVIDDIDTDIVEVTAHAGARNKGSGPKNHKSWQGKWYSLSGKSTKYPSLRKVTGYGTGEGLGGWNCRHQYHAVIPEISSPAYTKEQLKNIDPEPFGYKGRTYTHYEATQYQRKIETSMRATKREILGYEAAGDKEAFTTASIKLQRQKQEYREFSKVADLKTKNERVQELGYGKSISQKDVWTNKKVEKEANKMYDIGSTEENVKAYMKDKPIIDKLDKQNIEFIQRISNKEVIVKNYKPIIKGMTHHATDNLNNKIDRADMTIESSQGFIDNAKLVLYNTERETIKFISEKGYTVLNFDNKLITAVPQKWRNKYNKYLKEV